MRLNILLISLIIGCCGSIYSQADSEDKLQVHLTVLEQDSVVFIRWAPANMKSWNWGIENGFRLSRFTTGHDGVLDSFHIQSSSKIVLDSLILPLPENSWGDVDATEDQIDLGKGAIYEPSFIIDSMIGESDFARAYADQSDRASRFIFGLFAADQTFEIAKAMGLAYEDHDVDPTASYFYRIEFLGDVDSTLLRNGGIEVDLEDDSSLPQPGIIQIDQAIDTNILLVWDVSLLESAYASYNIERSTDSVTFTKVNSLPLVSSDQNGNDQSVVYFTDDVPDMDLDYYYRVKGVSPFGQEGPASPIVKVSPKPSPKASPPKITSLDIIADDVNVDWDFPSGEDSLISGFKIYRAQNALGPFELIDSVEADVRTWTDTDPITTGYYRIAAMDNAGVEVRAGDKLIQLDDETPPPVPSGLSCSVNEAGLVTVSWSPVSDPSLRGYRIFSGNGEDATFGEETHTPVSDTSFQFQTELQTLTPDIYLKVQSLDERENYSEYSEVCHAVRPDQVPPSKPVLLRANPLVMGVELEWIHSASTDLDKHVVQRKRKVDAGWTTVLEIDASGDSDNPNGVTGVATTVDGGKLTDTLAAYPYEYQYRVLAFDANQNQSSSEILTTVPFDSGERGQITDLEADTTYLNTISSTAYYTVELTWEYTSLQGLYNFQIYRSVDGKPMRAYKTTNGRGGINFEDVALSAGIEQVTPGTFSWTDPEMGNATIMAQSGYQASHAGWPVRRTMKYQVMARHIDGGWSPVSEVVEIQVMVPGR